MRLEDYILNEKSVEAAKIIGKNCGDFLKETKGKLLFRGSGSSGLMRVGKSEVYTSIPRKDRFPMDTPSKIHKMFDTAFQKHFGWKARSEGVFVTSSPGIAGGYSNYVFGFFPQTPYKYVYGKKIKDLYKSFGSAHKIMMRVPKEMREEFFLSDAIEYIVNEYYTDKNLTTAIKDRCELSFFCKKYYMVWIDEIDLTTFKTELFRYF